jgi:hypothetical protein
MEQALSHRLKELTGLQLRSAWLNQAVAFARSNSQITHASTIDSACKQLFEQLLSTDLALAVETGFIPLNALQGSKSVRVEFDGNSRSANLNSWFLSGEHQATIHGSIGRDLRHKHSSREGNRRASRRGADRW